MYCIINFPPFFLSLVALFYFLDYLNYYLNNNNNDNNNESDYNNAIPAKLPKPLLSILINGFLAR